MTPVLNTKVILRNEKVGKIVKDCGGDKVEIACTSVDSGQNNRVPPGNGRKILEPGENFN